MSKNLKKFLKSELAKIDARINVLEANLSRLVLAAVEAVSPQIIEEEKPEKSKRKKDKTKSKEVAAKKEVETKSEEVSSPETVLAPAAEEKKPRTRRSKEEIAAAKEAKTETTVVVEKKPRQRRTKEEIAAAKEANEFGADDLRNLEGIGAVYAEKLKTQGINNIQDMSELSDARVEELETIIKGFKKRMETQNWRAQAIDLLKK